MDGDVLTFVEAMRVYADSLAIKMIEDGRLDPRHALVPSALVPNRMQCWRNELPVLFAAVAFDRVEVVRAICNLNNDFARLAVSVAKNDSDEYEECNLVAQAITVDSPLMLDLLHSFGANFSCVRQETTVQNTRLIESALQYAISNCRNDCVEYLIDVLGMRDELHDRDPMSMMCILSLVKHGAIAIPVFETLRKRGWDFKHMEERYAELPCTEDDDEGTLKELLLRSAAPDSCTPLLRYLAKTLGCTMEAGKSRKFSHFEHKILHRRRPSNTTSTESWTHTTSNTTSTESWTHTTSNSSLEKGSQATPSSLACASCSLIDARNKCGRCGKARYCSKECQHRHWRAGHKAECVAKPDAEESVTE